MSIYRKKSRNAKNFSNIRILIIILSLLLGQSLLLFLKFNTNPGYIDDIISNEELETAGDAYINIITPENRTYTEPMSGHYPATYGFENDPQGTYGTDISFFDEWTGNVGSFLRINTLDGPYDGHNKLFWIFDSQAGGLTTGVHNFDNPQSSGTIEFWVRMEGAADVGSTDRFHQIHFRKSDNTIAFRAQLKMLEGGWVSGDRADVAYYNGATWVEFADGEDLAWYRHRIDFNCTESKYSWYIYHTDGSLLASITNIDFENPMTTLDEIYFTSITSHYRGATYWDAFGFDWEDNYNIGDNLHEGLLLGFNSNVTLDWIGYSLDGNPNNTILGNTTISFPKYDGLHSIQVSGNDTVGTMSQSDIRYFTTKMFNLKTPENITYTEPMSGYYPGTYGFENDAIGTDPIGWTDGSDSNCDSLVVQEKAGHKMVIYMDDDNGGAKARLSNYFPDVSYGMIEFWYMPEDATTWFSFRFMNIGLTEIRLEIAIEGDKWKYSPTYTIYYDIPNVPLPQDNMWQHVKIYFECTSGGYHGLGQYKFETIIDGVSSGELPFQENATSISSLYISSLNAGITDSWLDAVGYSWDPDYNIGDNQNEGLLLGFDSNVRLDYLEYSLDGNPTKNILGNTTFAMPSNGVHTIQVFGNDTIGNPYQSEQRYFTVSLATNIYEPSLSDGIVSPLIGDQKTLFTFEVNYTDLDDNPPEFVKVIINETEYMMTKQNPSDMNYTDGCIFQYSTYLNPSSFNYTYNFDCSDGIYSNSTSLFNNLNVLKTNLYEPQLLFPDVSPDLGGYNTMFNYTVWYFDEDNNQPNIINITIDQTTYLMSKYDAYDTNSTDGLLYFYNTSLDIGYYQFQINCSDGKFENSTNWIDGPEVNPFYTGIDVTLLNPLNMSSYFTGWVNFEWFSLDAPYGVVNYTFQISNVSDFSDIVFEKEDIVELPISTNLSVHVVFPTGIYYWRVCPVFDSFVGNWSDFFIFNLTVNNFAPSLNFGSVRPTLGDQFTIFNFTVSYFDQDNNSPLFLNVSINGTSHAMEKVESLDTDYTDGCVFQYLTTLLYASYNYTYSFSCSDGKYLYSSTVFNNLEVNPANHFAPQLLNPQISPVIGGISTLFNFTVWYFDADDNLPSFINITIDSLDFSMLQHNPSDTNAIDGILFYFSTTLNIGIHSFMVYCSDGKFTNSTESIIGPEINPFIGVSPPTLLNPIYNAEIPSQSINFSWSSLNPAFGPVNYTLQISNTVDFSILLYEITDIHELLDITEVQVDVDLPTGIYYWRVKAKFGTLEGDWSNIFKFNILINNFTPILISDTIFPLSGNQNTIFKFTVVYQDLDNNAPVYIRIIINGKLFLMEKQIPNDNNYLDGCTYQFLTLLKPSEEAYTYSLECYDGAYYASTSTYLGPIVSDEVPIYDKNDGLNNLNAENILALSISLILGIGIVVPSILLTERIIRKKKSKLKIKSKTSMKPKNSVIKKNK
ncbi:MAG: hypothetical protein FK730_17055 [Asgard group archaeon]|nr:hypothetical protein [Asgard group archaeon]